MTGFRLSAHVDWIAGRRLAHPLAEGMLDLDFVNPGRRRRGCHPSGGNVDLDLLSSF
jgi:hypothetical protein